MLTAFQATGILRMCFMSIMLLASNLSAQPGASNQFNAAIGPEVSGMRVSVRTAKKSFALGELFALDFFLQNVSTNTVSYTRFNTQYSFEIIGPDGKPVPLTKTGQNLFDPASNFSGHGGKLMPGQDYGGSWWLSDLFVMTNTGDYEIKLSVRASGGPGQESVWVPSAPLKVRIIPPLPSQGAVGTNGIGGNQNPQKR
jgi:hypothetical protein